VVSSSRQGDDTGDTATAGGRDGRLSTLWTFLRSQATGAGGWARGIGRGARAEAGAGAKGVHVGPFSLVRWISLSGLAAITLISIASGTMLSRFLTENVLRRDAVVASEFVQGVIEDANRKHATHPDHANVSAVDHLLRGDSHEASRRLKEFFILIAGMPDVLHANVYSTERTIVWSSRPELVGKRFVDNHELDEALAGEVVFEIGVAGEYDKKKAEHAVFESADSVSSSTTSRFGTTTSPGSSRSPRSTRHPTSCSR